MMEAGGAGAGGRDERVPQWGAQETRELIGEIERESVAERGEIERETVAARRSAKTIWEAVAARLRERGYRRTAKQCSCKWKNLVNRYKTRELIAARREIEREIVAARGSAKTMWEAMLKAVAARLPGRGHRRTANLVNRYEELKQEKMWHAETLKKLQNELKRKDNEITQQLKSEDFAQVVEEDKTMLIQIVDADRKDDAQIKQATCRPTSDSARSQDRHDKVKKFQRYIDELEVSRAELIRQYEEANHLLKKYSSDIPELSRGPELKMNCRDDVKQAKSDGLVDLDLVLKLTKCHEFFTCPLEVGCERLTDRLVVEGSMIARICNVPGKKIHPGFPEGHQIYIPPPRRAPVSTEPLWKLNMFGKFAIGGITECVFRLHRLGLCLNGKFSLMNFCFTTSNKIKFSADVKSSACHRTNHGMNLDYFAVHGAIIHILSLCRHGTPFDLELLLDLLCSQDPSEKQIIIRYNASLMDEIQKKNHFIIMYDRLKQIEEEDGVNSERVKKVLKFIKPEHGWETRLYDNEFSEMVCTRHAVDSGRVLKGEMDLLKTWRHNFTHLHETSTALSDEDQVDIMDSVSKGVVNQLQEGMHSIHELELPHLIHTMKK